MCKIEKKQGSNSSIIKTTVSADSFKPTVSLP